MQKIAICAPLHNFCWAISSQLRHVSTIGKKLIKHQYLLNMFSQYGELRPTNGRDHFGSLGHPSKFQRVLRLGFVVAPTSLNRGQPNFARCLAVFCARILYIHFWGLLSPNGVFTGAEFTLRPSLAFSCIGSVTARHLSSGREPNFAALSREHHLYSAGWPSCWASAHILLCLF